MAATTLFKFCFDIKFKKCLYKFVYKNINYISTYNFNRILKFRLEVLKIN